MPYARVLPVGGTKPETEAADPPPARRAREDDDRPRPRTRSRSTRRYDEPAKRGGSALPLALVAGGVLVLLTVGGVIAVAAVLFTGSAPNTAVAGGPSWATVKAADPVQEPDPFGHRKEEPRPFVPPIPDPPIGGMGPRFPDPPATAKNPRLPDPPKGDANTNALVTKHKEKLAVTASSQWSGWPTTHLIDGNEQTSWYSNAPDNTFSGSKPWVMLTFPEDVSVKRVTILGNRDPAYTTGYVVTDGKVELLAANDKVIATHELLAAGEKFDFDLRLDKPQTVRAIRFTMTKSRSGDCGLGEFQVE